MAMNFEINNINYKIHQEPNLTNVCNSVNIGMSKSKTGNVPEYEVTPAIPAEVVDGVTRTPAVPAVTSTSKTFTVDHTEVVYLDDPDPDDFTEYEDVTEKIATDWAKEVLGSERLTDIESYLDARVARQENPSTPTTGSGLPWA